MNSIPLKRCVVLLLSLMTLPSLSRAHDDDKKKPPTKARADLLAARKLMNAAKQKMIQSGRYACCVKAPPGSKVGGCDICAKTNGSCNCGANLAQGKGVCGDCLGGWKTGRGAFPGIKKESVTLLDSSHQAMPGMEMKDAPPELAQAQAVLNKAKRTLVQETRYACCIGHAGCDECAYEASCPCAKELAKGEKSKGVCGQCYDGQHAGIGRLQGIDTAAIKLNPMQEGMPGMDMDAFAGIPMSREASGTSWQPDSTPAHTNHRMTGLWRVMEHYNAFLTYDNQNGPRGDDQVNSLNWYMLMATRPLGKGELTLRSMFSLEPLTVGKHGYPLLFQNGESVNGKPLVNNQHPHDLFMELAGRFRLTLDSKTAAFLYVAPSGEPALGPTAYPHRLSAMDNPAAPISHHWQDGTHVTFGVLTAGISRDKWQLEGSYFNGREPDENRWDIDPIRLNSYSGRLSFNSGPNWSLQASYGYVKSPEALRPGEDVRRTTLSATYNRPLANDGNWASTFVWGRNSTGVRADSFLLETSVNIANRNTFFGRIEHVEKTGEDLALLPLDRKIPITEITLGGVHELTQGLKYDTGVGASVTFNWKSQDLDAIYGRSPMGFWLFLRIRPASGHHATP